MLKAEEQQKINKEYEEYFNNFNKTLEEFAKIRNLTHQDLIEIIKVNQRRLRKEKVSDDMVNQLGGPEKPKPLHARRTIGGRQKVLATRKTATRTKVTKRAGK